MATCLIVGASQTKYFHEYLPDSNLQVTVDSVSGRKIQDVSADSIAQAKDFDTVVLHLGTNNCVTPEYGSRIAKRLETLMKQIMVANPHCNIYISSILPRAISRFNDHGRRRRRHRHHRGCLKTDEWIDLLNVKATSVNLLYSEICSRYQRCHFINNDLRFKPRNTVRRHLLSNDGLHLTPDGIQELLGHMLAHVSRSLPVQQVASLPVCPPPPAFTPLPHTPSSSPTSVPSVQPPPQYSTSYRDTLLLPAATPVVPSKSSPSSQTTSFHHGRKLRHAPPVTNQQLLSSLEKPVKPSPFLWQRVTKGHSLKVSSSSCSAHSKSLSGQLSYSTSGSPLHSPLSDHSTLLSAFSTSNPYSSLCLDSTEFSNCPDSFASSAYNFEQPPSSPSNFSHSSQNGLKHKRRKRTGKKRHVRKQMEKESLKSFKEKGILMRKEDKRTSSNDQVGVNRVDRLKRRSSSGVRAKNVLCERRQVSERSAVSRDLGAGWMVDCEDQRVEESGVRDGNGDFQCVCSGNISQAHSRFGRSKNVQCVCISVINCIHVQHISRAHFDPVIIDGLIVSGDRLYKNTKNNLGPSHKEDFLLVDEVLEEVDHMGIMYKIERTWITSELYPSNQSELREKLDILIQGLRCAFETNSQSAYVFIGLGSAVSFWQSDDNYFIFNSHSVDTRNHFLDGGVGRVFRCSSLECLATQLFNNNFVESTLYEVTRITSSLLIEPMEVVPTDDRPVQNLNAMEVLDSDDMEVDRPINFNNDSQLLATTSVILVDILMFPNYNRNVLKFKVEEIDNKLSFKKPIVVLEDISELIKNNKSIKKSKNKSGRPKNSKHGHPSNRDNKQRSVNRKSGRPTKKHIGRPKMSTSTYDEQHREAVRKYTKTHPNVHRDSVRKYTDSNPQVHRDSVRKYTDSNPQVHRDSVRKYTDSNPQVNRNSVRKYTDSNPQVHRDSVRKYTDSNPQVHRDSVRKYTDSNPQVHRDSVRKYTDSNPQVHQDSVRKYAETNPQIHRDSVRNYKGKNPRSHLPRKLRKKGLIAEFSGDKLKLIDRYTLKNPSLRADSCYKCCHCGARLFKEEKDRKQWCCSGNTANIQNLAPLRSSFYTDKAFLEHPVKYNQLFAFSALVIPGFQKPPRQGLSFIKILGRTYHKIYNLSHEGKQVNTSRLFIDDGEQRLRVGQEKGLNDKIIKSIHTFLQSCNKLYPFYKTLHDEASEDAVLVFEVTSHATNRKRQGDKPTSDEVAAYISCDSEPFCPRKVCVWKKGEAKPHTIDVTSPLLEPLTYPLLYPEGTPGWHYNCKGRIKKFDSTTHEPIIEKLTLLKYTRCLLLSEDRFSKFGRLSETWLVDMFARIDEERLRFIKFGQLKTHNSGLRTAPADEIQATIDNVEVTRAIDDICNDETVHGEDHPSAGRIYLPSTYTGGPRYMKVSYLDAMALVSRFGGPTYFLTFTAFGGWDEIKLSKHKENKQQPDVVNRVFQLKLLELIRDIKCGEFFGKFVYVVWVIEFQMRGLPHAHICFRVENGPVQGSDIDKIVRADIPKIDEPDSRLRELVLKHMTHGPCGPNYRTDLPCWDEKVQKCTKRFPKPYVETTYTDERGFIKYKRSRLNVASIFCKGRSVEIDDRWVVPYNAALLIKYNCHINLEIASTRTVVKYLFKYITKGAPLRRVALVESTDNVDEVEEYVTKRYIGSSDAAWRVLEFDVTGRDPTVKHLPVHLKGKQSVFFHAGKEEQALEKSSSHLMIYFGRPRSSEMDNLTYLDFFEKFFVKPMSSMPKSSSAPVLLHPDEKHFITARQRGECVARMFWVSPTHGEQYYLRVLLSKYPCHGYSDLYLIGGPNCNTFQQAARAVGLVDDNREYFHALQEASVFMLGKRLREFFVILINEGCPAADMWEMHKDDLSEDFILSNPDDHEKAHKLALVEIDRCLRRHRSSLLEAGLPVVDDISTELGREKLHYTSSKQRNFVDEWEARLSSDQTRVFEHIKIIVDDPSSDLNRVLFIDGPGGSGKTLLLQVIAAYVRSLDRIALCVASSGIAALNLTGGTTAHTMFRLPLDLPDHGYWSITNGSQRAELIREASLIIYDEAPMAHKFAVEMIDRSLRDLMRSDFPFGNKVIVFAGDFRQIPPVVRKARTPSDIINCSVCNSSLWESVEKFKLTTSHRMSGNEEYSRFLLQLGSNLVRQRKIGSNDDSEVLVALPQLPFVSNIHELIDFVFPSNVLGDPDNCSNRAILCTLNSNVAEVNKIVCDSLEGVEHNLYSFDKIPDDDVVDIDESLLHHARGQGVPDHVLKLKVGSVCLIMRNLSFDLGLVNGTKVIVVAISRRLITCRRPACDELFAVPRINFKFPITLDSPIEMIRLQFPLQLAYAMTIHKSQGQTIDMVGLDLRTSCFTHGQLYVGLSRVRSPENIRILVPENHVVDGVPHAKNVVFPGFFANQ